MGRLIDEANVFEVMKHHWLSGSIAHHIIDDIRTDIIKNVPTVEAIPKDQYEARLKADMVAMLEEIDGDIERLQLMCDKDDLNNMYQYTAFGMARDKIIEKINELKAEKHEV